MPPFLEIDLRCDRRFLFDRFTLDLYVELASVTFNRQVQRLIQDSANGPLREDGFTVALPSIGLRAEL